MKDKAIRHLMAEIQRGWNSAEKDGRISGENAYRLLDIYCPVLVHSIPQTHRRQELADLSRKPCGPVIPGLL